MIPTIQDSVEPQGRIEIMRRGQATAKDFGGQMAEGMGQFAGGLNEAAGQLQQSQERQDNTDNYSRIAKAKVDWLQNISERAAAAPSGDQSLVPGVVKDMGDYFNTNPATTSKGSAQWTQMGAQLQAEMALHAIGIQGQMNGQAAVNDNHERAKTLAQLAAMNPKSVEDQIAANNKAIDDPNGSYFLPGMDGPTREKLKAQATETIAWAAATSWAKNNPLETLAALSPAIAAKFQLYQNLLQSKAVPGGKVSISEGTMAKAPEVVPVAASVGLSPSLPLAVMDQASTSPQEPRAVVSSLATLMGAYSGDTAKTLAAYHGGTQAIDKAMQMFGTDWFRNLLPGTQDFVNQVQASAGMVPTSASAKAPASTDAAQLPAQPPAAAGPVPDPGVPGWKYLPVDSQRAVAQQAMEFANVQMGMDARIQQQEKLQRSEATEKARMGYFQQIEDPKAYGKFDPKAVLADPVFATNPTEAHWLIATNDQHRREALADAENKTNPAVFHNLMVQIHAADTDPTKTYSVDNAWAAYNRGQLSWKDFSLLRNEVTSMKDGNQNPFQQQVHSAKEMAYNTFTKDFTATLPGGMGPAQDAYYRFQNDLDTKISEYRAQGKNPRTLLDPSAPDFALKPEQLAAFKPDAKAVVKEGAGKTIEASKLDRTPAPGFKVGEARVVNGKSMVYQGGPINLSTSWGVTAPVPPAAIPPLPAALDKPDYPMDLR